MLLVYTPRLTNRIGYTLNVLLKHLLRLDFSITTDLECFLAHQGEQLCYAPQKVGQGLFIRSSGLLHATTIEEQEPRPQQLEGQWVLFPVYGSDLDFPFDLLAATFFMVSRYEEYLPHRSDIHGRFPASQSLAHIHGFLMQPVVDQWAYLLRDKLKAHYPHISIPRKPYRFQPTVDIDAAWCYLHKGFFRTVGGLARDLFQHRDLAAVWRRTQVLLHRQPDPFDTFDYILSVHQQHRAQQLIFFALMADYGRYDKPSNHLNPHTRNLLQHLDDYARVGIHPGYTSLAAPARTDAEVLRLEQILHHPIAMARYHYLRLQLPQSYRILIHGGILHDFTMGFPDAVGFRAGVATPYPYYDLERDQETLLTVHPFCVMDTTLRKHLRLSPEQAQELCQSLIDNVRIAGGTFCSIIHNENLSDLNGWLGWRQTFEQMYAYASE